MFPHGQQTYISDDTDCSQPQSACPEYFAAFNKHVALNGWVQKQLEQEHKCHPFTPWWGSLVIRFSDETTMQTSWVKLASALEKMHRDNVRVSAMIQLVATDEGQRRNIVIGSGLVPRAKSGTQKEEDSVVHYGVQTRMMSEQNGRSRY